MKKLILVLFLFIGIAAHAQFPVTQSIGSSTTTTLVKGLSGAQYGVLIQSPYADTSSINSSTTLDGVAGVIVRTGSDLWVRNSTATKWNSLSGGGSSGPGGSTVYTSGSNSNTFEVNAFRLMSLVQNSDGPVVSTARIENEADSSWFRLTFTGNVPGKTSGYMIAQSDSLNRMTTLGLNPTNDSTKGFQVLMNKTTANIGYRSGASHLLAASDSLKGVSIDATTKVRITGNSFLFPRLTTSQRTALPTPEEGLAVYDLDLHKLYIWDGTAWQGAW